jgi:MOSC domain-containing protein YiiM
MTLQVGRIVGLYAALDAAQGFVTAPVGELAVSLDGVAGDRHGGRTRPAGPREPWMPKGFPVRNDRQLSALSVEDLSAIAAGLALDAVRPELIGANIMIEGVEAFSRLAPGSHLAIGGAWGGKGQFDGDVILKAEAYNRPCRGPGRKLAAAHGRPELEFGFVTAAKSLRGLVLSISAAGTVRLGDAVVVIPPVTAP